MNIQSAINKLNKEQHQAVTASLGPYLVIAGAGTGKTQVLTLRMAFMINEYHINPQRILGFTFTKKAATEMQERVRDLIDLKIPNLGTFHAFCARVLREDIARLGYSTNYKIIDQLAAIDLLHIIYEEKKYDYKELPYKKVLSIISLLKTVGDQYLNTNFKWKDNNKASAMTKQDLKNIFDSYQQKCKQYSYVDYDDLLLLTAQLFMQFPDVLTKWQNRFDAVLVDEFQDTNEIQYQLVQALAQKHSNVFAVGDPDQMIYSFRGAKERVLSQFQYDFPATEIIVLKMNYRSSQEILDAANNLINTNTREIKKHLISFSGSNTKPTFKHFMSEEDEVTWIVQSIISLKEKNIPLQDICVLFRSNQMSRAIEQRLIEYGISYNLFGSRTFFEREEIRDIISYLHVIQSWDELALIRIINKPRRKIGAETLDLLKKYANEHNITLAEAMSKVDLIPEYNDKQRLRFKDFYELISELKAYLDQNTLVDIVPMVLEKIAYREFLASKEETADNKWDNVMELQRGIERYYQNISNAELSDYLNDITLYTNDDSKRIEDNAVNLMTVHTSKGLEFPYVFLMRMNQGDFPSYYSIEEQSIEEERRVCYVALTRAKKALYLTASPLTTLRSKKTGAISQFVNEIGVKNLENLSSNLPKTPAYRSYAAQSLQQYENDLSIHQGKKQIENIQNNYHQKKENNYFVGDEVIHTVFGSGVVVGKDQDNLEIYFSRSKKHITICYNIKSLSKKEK
ncbi:ATP-dependent helicase [Ureaplasma sp. ES3154-GEN]|uniref:ATP-dependent helicase n=1 Tax=Ureaplasma sp. ES3154-GEN TaxID=2984844 RepID=UPI0021E84BBD|nr:ATP-dependent helicase [Ureaplasma sp. ES3154-GEN]MCV3743650.1 ATP-dependent helicase [Ureaplasma sp. ES3154-GEN]